MFYGKDTKGFHIYVEPGDATRYEFIGYMDSSGRVYVAGSPNFSLYSYGLDEILAAHNRLGDEPIGIDKPLNDGTVRYVTGHSNCNPHTARAMIHAVAMWVLESHGQVDHNQVNEKIRMH